MRLLHAPSLVNDLSKDTLLIDSTALINASKSDVFLSLLKDIRSNGCAFITIPSVIYEFTRGAKNLDQLNKQNEIINGLGITVMNRIEDKIDDMDRAFIFAYTRAAMGTRSEKGPSYTDSLLCLTAYKYRHTDVKVLTANSKDMPLSIFDRQELIIIDIAGDLRIEAIYAFSETKFGKLLDKLI